MRIEDDLLIKEKDYELLSWAAPRKISDIEKMVAEKARLIILPYPNWDRAKRILNT
ncbi:hypothetical protein [Paraflavitalea speifideaquila]|uniref:hypothetical protein n=1 Tax=Paraflavitalea speifideaquila TaxID=3076558 RepID=UPI0028E34799|nr:hypothetical protein [Paraflavitalea speifideiaquila]